MSDEMIALRTLLERSPDADLLREIDRLCRAPADGAGCRGADRAGHGERSPERFNYRNG